MYTSLWDNTPTSRYRPSEDIQMVLLDIITLLCSLSDKFAYTLKMFNDILQKGICHHLRPHGLALVSQSNGQMNMWRL